LKAAIYSRVMDRNQQPSIQLFFDELTRAKHYRLYFKPYLHEIKGPYTLPETTHSFATHEDLTQDIDFLISLGGDGTLLDTVTLVRNKRIPVVGINFGRLGFLASIGRDELRDAVKALASRSFIIDKRTLIHVDSNLPVFQRRAVCAERVCHP
jgi:NAD+ kinase